MNTARSLQQRIRGIRHSDNRVIRRSNHDCTRFALHHMAQDRLTEIKGAGYVRIENSDQLSSGMSATSARALTPALLKRQSIWPN